METKTQDQDQEQAGIRHPWDQRPCEADEWFNRFVVYRELGQGRTLLQAYLAVTPGEVGQSHPRFVPSSWRQTAQEDEWRERAAAWDFDRQEHVRQQYEALADRAEVLSIQAIEVLTELMSSDSERQRLLAAAALLRAFTRLHLPTSRS